MGLARRSDTGYTGFMRALVALLAAALCAAAPGTTSFDLAATFRSVLPPEQAQSLAAESSVEALARTFTPQQHQAARTRLREAEEQTRDPRALAEIHRGYLALREAEGAWRVGDTLVSRFPDSPAGYTMRGQAAELRGDVELAAEEAREALRRDPHDRAAHALLRLTEGRGSATSGAPPPAAADGAVSASGGFLAAPRSGASAEALNLMRQAVRAREAANAARDMTRKTEGMARVQALAQAAMSADPRSVVVQRFYGLVQEDRRRLTQEHVGVYAALERRQAEERARQDVAAELEAARRAARRREVPPLAPLGAGAVLLTLGLMAWDRGLREAARDQARQFAAGSLIVLGCAGIAYGASALIVSAPRAGPSALEFAGNAGTLGRITGSNIAMKAAPAAGAAAAAPLLMQSSGSEKAPDRNDRASDPEPPEAPAVEKPAKDEPRVTFQTKHAKPHFKGLEVPQSEVEAAIRERLKAQTTSAKASFRGLFNGRVAVRGQQFEYRGFGHDDGSLSIGTIYPIP